MKMKFTDAVKNILSTAPGPMTPQDIREQVKSKYPDFYGTPAHNRCVEKGYYKNIDNALLAQIYTVTGTSTGFQCDRTTRPMKISLSGSDNQNRRWRTASGKSAHHKRLTGKKVDYGHKVNDILLNAAKYHHAYYQAETFRGPSLYFHERALATRQDPSAVPHLEYVYSTLASWGMHRMGRGGSKMQRFDVFSHSVQIVKNKIVEARTFDLQKMSEREWEILSEIFRTIKVMASGTTIVGNSKVMHHMLPNVIPPIDREYTLWYLRGNTTITNDLETEWILMKEIISQFFAPLVSNKEFHSMAKHWMERNEYYPWDTSVLKVVDNLVIGSKK